MGTPELNCQEQNEPCLQDKLPDDVRQSFHDSDSRRTAKDFTSFEEKTFVLDDVFTPIYMIILTKRGNCEPTIVEIRHVYESCLIRLA
jgi:hypothetical protein